MPGTMTDLEWTVPVSVTFVPTSVCLAQPTYEPLGFVVGAADPAPVAVAQGEVFQGDMPAMGPGRRHRCGRQRHASIRSTWT